MQLVAERHAGVVLDLLGRQESQGGAAATDAKRVVVFCRRRLFCLLLCDGGTLQQHGAK
jgi:hypothetical protein